MVFSSHIFIFYFLALILGAYYFSPRRLKHLVLTLGSYLFYAWWNPWFVLLMIASTFIDFLCGKIIFNSTPEKAQRKIGLLISIAANLSILGSLSTETFLRKTFLYWHVQLVSVKLYCQNFSIKSFCLLESPSTHSNQCHTQLTFIEKKRSLPKIFSPLHAMSQCSPSSLPGPLSDTVISLNS